MRLAIKAAAGALAMCLGGPVVASTEPALTFEQGQALAKKWHVWVVIKSKPSVSAQALLRLLSAMLDNLRHLNT